MDKQLKTILYKSIKFLIIFILVDFTFGSIATKLIFIQKTGKYGKLIEALDKSNANIFIFGSSHALRHYDNKIIEASTRQSYFNVGSKGQKMIFQTVVLKTLLERHIPKTIILDIDDDWLEEFPAAYDRLGSLHPLYSKHQKVLREALSQYDKFIGLKLLFKSYQQNSTFLHVLRYFALPKPKSNNGFEPLQGNLNAKDSVKLKNIFTILNNNKQELDTNFIQSLEEFISITKTNNINLVFCISPNLYYKSVQNNKSYNTIKKIANKNKIKLYDFTNNNLFINKYHLFNDVDHLNKVGAIKYTNLVVDSVQFNTTIIKAP